MMAKKIGHINTTTAVFVLIQIPGRKLLMEAPLHSATSKPGGVLDATCTRLRYP
jgi:hypothetical protein